MDRLPYLLFTGQPDAAEGVRAPDGAHYKLSQLEQELAHCFDGNTPPSERWSRAQAIKPGLTPAEWAQLGAELGQCGLLQSGSKEPLPVPAQGDSPNTPTVAGFPPSHLAGSLAAPGYPGGVTGWLEQKLGGAHQHWRRFEPGNWLKLGDALNRTLDPPALRYGLWILAAAGLLALWFYRLDAARDAARLVTPLNLLIVGLLSAGLINLLSQLARAAAIRRCTGQLPVINQNLFLHWIPYFVTDTSGPAERADRASRIRIIGASLNAALVIFVMALFGWFLSQRLGSAVLPCFFLGLAASAMAVFLIQANPLAQRDGYHLLAQSLNVPDLRDQAWMALFSRDRAWASMSPLPRRNLQLYAAAVGLFVIGVITLLIAYPGRWLETAWGGTGVVAFVLMVGFSVWEQTRRYRSPRQDIGAVGGFSLKLKAPSRRTGYLLGAAVLVSLLPYTYDASGEFVVLPKDRADVRALVRGEVREVLVKEGDQVEAGQMIARLSDYQEKAQAAASEARLQQLKADLALAEAGAREEEIEIARQRVNTARTRFEVADAEAKRLEAAHQRKAVSVQDYQRAKGSADVQAQELAEAERSLELVTGGTRQERIDAQKAQVAAEEAQLAYYQEQLRNTRIRAPIAGRVVSGSLLFARGRYLESGELLAVIEDTRELRAEFRVPESQAPDVAVGAEASVRVWAMPGTAFAGTVREVAPNAEDGPYGKVVRVLVALEPTEGRLRPQMTGQGKIEGRTYPVIVVFTKALARFFLIEVWSWLP